MFRILSKKAKPSVRADESFWTELRWFHAFFVQHVCNILKNWTKKVPKSSEVCNGEVDAINFQNVHINIKSFLWNPCTLNCRTCWILEISIEKSSKRNSTTDSKMMRLMKWFVNFRCFAIFVHLKIWKFSTIQLIWTRAVTRKKTKKRNFYPKLEANKKRANELLHSVSSWCRIC